MKARDSTAGEAVPPAEEKGSFSPSNHRISTALPPQAVLVGAACAAYSAPVVILAAALTAAVVVGMVLFTLQTKVHRLPCREGNTARGRIQEGALGKITGS